MMNGTYSNGGGRTIVQIVATPSINPFLPSTLTCVCSDGTVWSKTDAPAINLFGALTGQSNQAHWVQVSAPPAPIALQPVYIPQPVVQQQPMLTPVMQGAQVVPFMQQQPVQFSEHREYRSEPQTGGQHQGGGQHQPKQGDRDQRMSLSGD